MITEKDLTTREQKRVDKLQRTLNGLYERRLIAGSTEQRNMIDALIRLELEMFGVFYQSIELKRVRLHTTEGK